MSKFFRLALATLFLVVTSAVALAQSQASSGQIAGTVTDSAGSAVANASVKVKSSEIGLERDTTTNEDGVYQVVLLPPGTYEVTAEASASNFAPTTLSNVVVTVGGTTDANLTLGAGNVTASVEVTAETIETTRPESDAVVNQDAINNLPINGRRFQDFVTLTPTAQVEPSRGQISLSGQRGINGNINIDGVDYNQPFFGGIRGGERSNNAFTIPQESIREFQVVAAGYAAEFGRSTGGVVNAVTKSGTNEFRGSGFYLVRPKGLASRNAFGQEASFTQHQFGGSLGGPVVNDKIFFFTSYEQQRLRQPREVQFTLLNSISTPPANQAEAFNFFQSLEEPFQQTNDAKAFLIRADFVPSQSNRFNVRYNYSTNTALNATSTGNSLDPVTNFALSNNGTEIDKQHTLVGQLASIFSPTVVNELRGQFAYEERPRLANVEAPGVQSAIGRFGTVQFLPSTQFDRRIQFADSLTWTTGNHTFKFGGDYNHVFTNQLFAQNQFGYFIFGGTINTATVLDVLSYTPTITTGVVNRFDAPSNIVQYLRQIGTGVTDITTDEIAAFGQDSWRIRPNFTLYYGLRWEGQYNSQPEANNTDLVTRARNTNFPAGYIVDATQIPDSTKQFAPRLGFAWDPTNDSKTVVRGYAGLYYARSPMLLFSDPISTWRLPPGNLSISLPLNTNSLPASNPLRGCNTVYCQLNLIGINLNTFSLGELPIITPEQVQQVGAALGLSTNPFVGAQPQYIDQNFRNPKAFQFGGAFEREVMQGLTIGVDFSYVNTVYLQRNRDVNLPVPIVRASDPAQRPFFGLAGGGRSRPNTFFGSLQVRESSARSLYRALTVRAVFRRKWGQLNAFYTLSSNYSDDDNERSSGGSTTENVFDLRPEYNYSDLDRRHQFVASPLFFLPYGFEVTSAIRLRSGRPIDVGVVGDANQSGGFGRDRPFSAPGVPFERNAFRNRGLKDVDLRVQKSFHFSEERRLVLSAEIFNIFEINNIEYSGTTVTNYCNSAAEVTCGFGAPTNVNFLSITDNNPASPRFGQYLLNNNAGAPRQIQLGVRFMF